MYQAVLALVALTVAPAFAQDQEKPLNGDLAKLQGRWTATAGPQKDIPLEMEIKGTKLVIRLTTPDGADIEMSSEIKLDEKADPKKWDWVNRKLNGEPFPDGETIYKIEGDSLTICGGNPGVPRPTEFKQAEDGQAMLIVFTKAKAKDAEKKKADK
jgi:uncharacterized protein (TIGR03067 family)